MFMVLCWILMMWLGWAILDYPMFAAWRRYARRLMARSKLTFKQCALNFIIWDVALTVIVLIHNDSTWQGRITLALVMLYLLLSIHMYFMPSPPALSLEEAKAKGEKLMADLRQQGLYPPDGTGTDADVQRLVQAGHFGPALRLY